VTSLDSALAARPAGSAFGAFTCYDAETARAVLGAADELRLPVILLIGETSLLAPGGDLLLAALSAMAAHARQPAWVQLDHSRDLAAIERAFELGAASVMADGSHLAYDDNCELVAAAVAIARRYDGHVEAELGGIRGDEDVAEAVRAGALTEPAQAGDFLARTGARCLAASIGNVHGVYRDPPSLDWQRLGELRRAAGDCTLSLHGASGLDAGIIRLAIQHGVAKINVNTELREAYFAATAEHATEFADGLRLLQLHREQEAAVRRVVIAKLRAFRGP
jgi:ketose-bisphosphate aldolase